MIAASSRAPFGLLLAKLGDQPLHLVIERLAVILLRLHADVAARCTHVAVPANLVQRGAPPLALPVAWARMNSIDCTNMPEEPQQGS